MWKIILFSTLKSPSSESIKLLLKRTCRSMHIVLRAVHCSSSANEHVKSQKFVAPNITAHSNHIVAKYFTVKFALKRNCKVHWVLFIDWICTSIHIFFSFWYLERHVHKWKLEQRNTSACASSHRQCINSARLIMVLGCDLGFSSILILYILFFG